MNKVLRNDHVLLTITILTCLYNLVDMITTLYLVNKFGIEVELNIISKLLLYYPIIFIIVKLIINTAIFWVLYYWRKETVVVIIVIYIIFVNYFFVAHYQILNTLLSLY